MSAHAGATTDLKRPQPVYSPEPGSVADSHVAAIAKELGRRGRYQEDSPGAAKGTLASIGREEEQCTFITRDADRLT
eukprot:10786627-Heterocapsa_arctica.AAC.1